MSVLEDRLQVLKNTDIGLMLIEWGELHFRSFPWRYTFDPFKVAISEMLLRRTRALQVVSPYMEIICKYKDMCEIASADRKCLTSSISSLGIYKRIDLILNAAEYICNNSKGVIPSARNQLAMVPGFGEYTVSAIRVFAYSERDPLIDANTVRILSRLLGIKNSDSLRRTNLIRIAYETVLQNTNPVKFGYSILDLGAIVCSRTPKCKQCPISKYCSFNLNNKISR